MALPTTSQPNQPRRDPYHRAEDETILAEIRTITDTRPTYGFRRVTALLNRAKHWIQVQETLHSRTRLALEALEVDLHHHHHARAIASDGSRRSGTRGTLLAGRG